MPRGNDRCEQLFVADPCVTESRDSNLSCLSLPSRKEKVTFLLDSNVKKYESGLLKYRAWGKQLRECVLESHFLVTPR